ncbi:hypothetical protein LTR08_004855 [Meristemomyces frigidus]|nr:hypothetical protein LTR08_004855 [Meristemomyces frigidus]
MERRASQATAPPPAQHRHTPSIKSGVKATGTTAVALFVTNLRLLDLDLLPDWPAITTASFGNQDARARTRCTEFALFQLFRLYDPATTADKLQPFWPPLEPLQSINLRAALYRCLNELKKSGVLGKETVLRKTMLDECSGDKLWELCLGFSALVLKSATMARRNRVGKPVAEKIGTAHSVSQSERSSMLPLSIAHKASLAKVLEEKKRKKQAFVRLYDLLAEKEAELSRRKRIAQDQGQARPSKERMQRLETVEQHVKKHWVGSQELQNVLLHGDTTASGDVVLTGSLDQIANLSVAEPTERGLLESLSRVTTRQNQRSHRWQSMNEKLRAVKQTSAKPGAPDAAPGQPCRLQLDKHRSLSVKVDWDPSAAPPRRRSKSNAGAARYDEILTAMRDELRHTRRQSARPTSAPLVDIRYDQPTRKKSIVPLYTAAGATEPPQRSPSQTAVPVRPSLSSRVSSRSRSYQQPKVDSQRQPIPLKSELFSPLKTQHRSGHSPLSSSSVMASPIEEEFASGTAGLGLVVAGGARHGSQSSDASGAVDSGVGLGAGIGCGGKHTASERSVSGPPSESDEATAANSKQPLTSPALASSNPEEPHPTAKPSLAERTRISMAFLSRDDTSTSPPPHEPPLPLPPPPPPTEHPQPTAHPTPASLADRTRQTISLAPSPASAYKKGHARARSSIYPINQFDTPQRKPPRRSSLIGLAGSPAAEGGGGRRRDVTPREKLFSPDAEYDSVFKPRPKVGISPVGSPAGGGVEGGVVGRGSPLGGR